MICYNITVDEYQSCFEAAQFNIGQCLTIANLHFTYEDVKIKRKRFMLELDQPITLQTGETILITGNSSVGEV